MKKTVERDQLKRMAGIEKTLGKLATFLERNEIVLSIPCHVFIDGAWCKITDASDGYLEAWVYGRRITSSVRP